MERLRAVEANLVPLVVAAAAAGVAVPGLGIALTGAIPWLLALLLLCVSLTFDLTAVRVVARRPGVQGLATLLVYGPMSLIAHLLGRLAFGAGAPLAMGTTLVGVLPTDVSAPLLVWIARGDVALATVLNAVNTAVSPLLVPALFLLLTGVRLDVPLGPLVGELALVVLLPTVLGVAVRTVAGRRVAPLEPGLSALSSLCYLALLLAVVGPNAATIRSAPALLAGVAAVALVLNVSGYLVACAAFPLLPQRSDRVALLFTVAKKEFTIAALVVSAAGLPEQIALPAAVYAVVQMLTSPLVARRLARAP